MTQFNHYVTEMNCKICRNFVSWKFRYFNLNMKNLENKPSGNKLTKDFIST